MLGGSTVAECLTEGPEVWASSTSLCFVLDQDTFILFSTGSTQEDQSRHNWKIVDWDVKNQNKQTKNVVPDLGFRLLQT